MLTCPICVVELTEEDDRRMRIIFGTLDHRRKSGLLSRLRAWWHNRRTVKTANTIYRP